jgi:hypothetical protein
MSSIVAVRIPAGKLGTVRIDRTVDVYSTAITYNDNMYNVQTSTPDNARRSCSNASADNHPSSNDDADIAVIYSVVRRASIRRTSSPRICVQTFDTHDDQSAACKIKSYTLESSTSFPVVHQPVRSSSISHTLLMPSRRQTSNSFTSHDRPLIPWTTIKPRPYSFRNSRPNVLERQISHITERVSQLHESFLSRLSNAPHRQRNRSLSTCHAPLLSMPTRKHTFDHRPKSELFDNEHLSHTGTTCSRTFLDTTITLYTRLVHNNGYSHVVMHHRRVTCQARCSSLLFVRF